MTSWLLPEEHAEALDEPLVVAEDDAHAHAAMAAGAAGLARAESGRFQRSAGGGDRASLLLDAPESCALPARASVSAHLVWPVASKMMASSASPSRSARLSMVDSIPTPNSALQATSAEPVAQEPLAMESLALRSSLWPQGSEIGSLGWLEQLSGASPATNSGALAALYNGRPSWRERSHRGPPGPTSTLEAIYFEGAARRVRADGSATSPLPRPPPGLRRDLLPRPGTGAGPWRRSAQRCRTATGLPAAAASLAPLASLSAEPGPAASAPACTAAADGGRPTTAPAWLDAPGAAGPRPRGSRSAARPRAAPRGPRATAAPAEPPRQAPGDPAGGPGSDQPQARGAEQGRPPRRAANASCPFSHAAVGAASAVELRCGHCFALSHLRAAREAARLCVGAGLSAECHGEALICPLCGDQAGSALLGARGGVLTAYSADKEAYLGEARKDWQAPLELPHTSEGGPVAIAIHSPLQPGGRSVEQRE
ncbi:unnamed protein product [Prorocentrum cordatum]|uniref:RING-type domain-containing protein n=1 Tax=Prorocentrum cordatum TaxID=2364126 RepID=A0ABN9VE32_9DINO|nr:unnamed protein product [Polarella glacialis]